MSTTPTPFPGPGTLDAAAVGYDAAYQAAYQAVRAANPGRKPTRRAVLALALAPFLSKRPSALRWGPDPLSVPPGPLVEAPILSKRK